MRLFGKSLELVILDVDGVIIDILPLFREILPTIALRLGLPKEPVEGYIREVATGNRRDCPSFSGLLREFWPRLSNAEVTALLQRLQDWEDEIPFKPVDGSVETIRWFQERSLPVALCTTNKLNTLARRIGNVGLNVHDFSALSTLENSHIKPDPRALDPIFAKVPVDRENAVYIGDWYPDIRTASGGGVRFVAVLSGSIPKSAFLDEGVPEDHIVEKLADIVHLVS